MGDVAQILAGAAAASASASASDALSGPFRRRSTAAAHDAAPGLGALGKPKKKKLSREVSALLGDQPAEVLAPMVG
jgi:hypothetical protein